MAAGLVSPDRFPIRDPKDKSQSNGRCINFVRYPEFGGMTGPQVWFKEIKPDAFAQSPQANVARVDKATSVKSAHKSSREDD